MSAGKFAQAEFMLIVCSLFVCLELLQINYGTALDGLKYGLRIQLQTALNPP
jgi:hypothetical protein